MFTVVMPLYNKAHTIEGTLLSVLNQTFSDFEIVIINDGSTDNGVEVINKFSSDVRIRIINQVNQGVSVARNEGVKKAKYDFIAFLDGDDEWMPEYLKKMDEAIKRYPNSDMFCSGGMSRNAAGKIGYRLLEKYNNQVVEFKFFENPHVFLHISATVISKKIFYKTNGFPIGMKRNEDFAFLYSLAFIAKPIYSGFPLSIYVGGVAGQATSVDLADDVNLLKDSVDKCNLVYENWLKSGSVDKDFIVFMKYELAHGLMTNLVSKQLSLNDYYLQNLNEVILNHFNRFELFLFNSRVFRKVSILYIKVTKVRWRMRGFQRVK